jgi:hypothetical protein
MSEKTRSAELETALLALCAKIDDLGLRSAAAAANGHNKRAGVLALQLVSEAARVRTGLQMQNEQAAPDRFDLGALSRLPGGGMDEMARFDLPDDDED